TAPKHDSPMAINQRRRVQTGSVGSSSRETSRWDQSSNVSVGREYYTKPTLDAPMGLSLPSASRSIARTSSQTSPTNASSVIISAFSFREPFSSSYEVGLGGIGSFSSVPTNSVAIVLDEKTDWQEGRERWLGWSRWEGALSTFWKIKKNLDIGAYQLKDGT